MVAENEGGEGQVEIIIQTEDGSFHRLTPEVLEQTRMSDDEVEKFIAAAGNEGPNAAQGQEGMPNLLSGFVRAAPFGFMPMHPPALFPMASSFVRVWPTGFARVVPSHLVRAVPSAVVRAAPSRGCRERT
jgi:hypothetical protein